MCPAASKAFPVRSHSSMPACWAERSECITYGQKKDKSNWKFKRAQQDAHARLLRDCTVILSNAEWFQHLAGVFAVAHLIFVNKTVFVKESRGILCPYIIKSYGFIAPDIVSGEDTLKSNRQSGHFLWEIQVKAKLPCKFYHWQNLQHRNLRE